jgi:hypothetical protein
MKTTLGIDEKRLRSVMTLTGLKTRRAAVDYSLAEVEHLARVSKVMERAWTPAQLKDVLAPRYDVIALRERERAGRIGIGLDAGSKGRRFAADRSADCCLRPATWCHPGQQ